MASDYDALRQERLATISDAHREMLEHIPHLRQVGVEAVRGFIAQGGRAVPVADGVSVRDVEIDAPAGPVPTRIYTPDGVDPSGVVLHVHHGGYVAGGGLGTLDGMDSQLAAAVGCAVVAPDFRLPPEHRFPAGLEDCWAVLGWIGGQDGWADLPVALGGGCTGGNFAAVLALMARDAGGPPIALQFLESFVADARCDTASQHEFADGYGLRYLDGRWVVDQYLSDPTDRFDWRVSPLLAGSVAGVAPAFVSVGEWDILRDEDVQYADRLRDAGVEVELHVLERQGHFPGPENAAERGGLRVAALRRAFARSAVRTR